MRVSRFYCPNLSATATQLVLPERVYRHAIQVLRLKSGAVMQLFDGKGLEREAVLSLVEKRQAEVTLGAQIDNQSESPLPITLLQGVSRGEKMDFAIQKAVELGVTRIVPVLTQRSNVQLKGERAEKRYQHWQGVIESACEQSGRAWLPELAAISELSTVLQQQDAAVKLVLDPQADIGFSQLHKPDALSLLIGPEGGLSDEEIQQAQQHGFIALRFGPRILRTETAALATLAVVQTLWGDLA